MQYFDFHDQFTDAPVGFVELLLDTVMERTHTPLSVWFWAAYLVASQTPGMSAIQFQRQLGLSRYETRLPDPS